MDKKRTKLCDLCGEAVARVLCESDEAALCWGCDASVHGANFLVARHVRALMCRVCLDPTAWLASGARVGPAASLCGRCLETEEHGGAETIDAEGEGENLVVSLKLAPPVSDDSSGSSTLPPDDHDHSCASTQRSNSRYTEAESSVAEHDATSLSRNRNRERSKRRKRAYATTIVHATSSYKI